MRAHSAFLVASIVASGCAPSRQRIPDAWQLGGQTRANHIGPLVSVGNDGPRRFISALMDAFDSTRAMKLCAGLDEHYREPGNEGYEAGIDRLRDELAAAGYGSLPGFEMRIIESSMPGPAWTPVSARLVLHGDGPEQVLHRLDRPADHDRCLLPVHAPSAAVSGPVVLDLEDVVPKSILVTKRPLREVLAGAQSRGAAAVLSSALQEICVDPSGEDRHLTAIAYESVRRGTDLPVGQISPQSYAVIRRAGAGAVLDYSAEVRWDERPLRTLVAEVIGVQRPDDVVTLVAHLDEPGACDNASGTAGLAEAARAVASAAQRGQFLRPRSSVAFVFGEEYDCSRVFLEDTERRPIAGFSADMTGSSEERTGAICLLERAPDPGAVTPLPPDEHTPWGAGEVRAEELFPHGLNLITRMALVDVGLVDRPWLTREHPWEGGSDHDVFLARGVPGVLVWHFTDFAYHTSLDRMDHVDAGELQRTSVALMAAALAVADARPGDMKRYLDTLYLERRLRLNMIDQEGAGPELAALWEDWFVGARHWLRRLCLGLDEQSDPLPETSRRSD